MLLALDVVFGGVIAAAVLLFRDAASDFCSRDCPTDIKDNSLKSLSVRTELLLITGQDNMLNN